MNKRFYGWWITIAAFFTFGIAVGIPYYGGPFFYDYYEKAFGWKRTQTTLGFPLAALFTLWVGPVLVHRFSPRKMIIIGTGLTALAFVGFGMQDGSLTVYYLLWFLYITGYLFSGPIAHQVITSHWFKQQRGRAMAIVYLGVGVFGGISAKYIEKPITEAFGYRNALFAVAAIMFLAWPIALFVMKDRPEEIGQFPDGAAAPAEDHKAEPKPIAFLLKSYSFWLLTIGSLCSIGAIGSINQHMKFVFKEQGFTDQSVLNELFGNATLCILFSSIGGRLFMGYLADKFNKKLVMVMTYALVAATIPLLGMVRPENPNYVYVFSILFGFGMGADYMLIPLMAAEQYGVNTLARAMAFILPADTIGQTWFPFAVAKLHDQFGGYGLALNAVFAMSAIGAIAILLLPKSKRDDATFQLQDAPRAAASR
jgi:MFS family permease